MSWFDPKGTNTESVNFPASSSNISQQPKESSVPIFTENTEFSPKDVASLLSWVEIKYVSVQDDELIEYLSMVGWDFAKRMEAWSGHNQGNLKNMGDRFDKILSAWLSVRFTQELEWMTTPKSDTFRFDQAATDGAQIRKSAYIVHACGYSPRVIVLA